MKLRGALQCIVLHVIRKWGGGGIGGEDRHNTGRLYFWSLQRDIGFVAGIIQGGCIFGRCSETLVSSFQRDETNDETEERSYSKRCEPSEGGRHRDPTTERKESSRYEKTKFVRKMIDNLKKRSAGSFSLLRCNVEEAEEEYRRLIALLSATIELHCATIIYGSVQ